MSMTDEQRHEIKSAIFRMIALRPSISGTQLHKALAESNYVLSYDRTLDLMKEVRNERALKITQDTKEEVFAQYDELCEYIMGQLREIISQEKITFNDRKGIKQQIYAQANRIEALKAIMMLAEKRMNIRMDLGLLERKLGTVEGRIAILDIMEQVRERRKAYYAQRGIPDPRSLQGANG